MSERFPVAAGSFYTSDPNDLQTNIENLLSTVDSPTTETPQIILVPHAGYRYSGAVAAYAYKLLENKNLETVILLGTSHQGRFPNAAVYQEGIWATPLGKVEVDKQKAQNLIQNSSIAVSDSQIHQMEHSLEVQLPFLQGTLDDFKIIPILLGTEDKQSAHQLAETLEQIWDTKTLLIVSSDLSHYPHYEAAKKVDQETVEAITSLNVSRLEDSIEESMSQGHSNLSTCACGAGAIKAGMYLADLIEANRVEILTYANSGDTTGDKNRVVGYAALGFF